tara:strand:- start:14 stop:1003 length:990 start_codon:yes stop_codon:yes gene_type:complete
MEHSQLGTTGLAVSKICLGTMTFGNQCDEKTSHAILDKANSNGITFIDTADMYPAVDKESIGETERIIGRWMNGKRDDVVLATKFFAPMGSKPWQGGSSRRHIFDAVDSSLKRLKTDFIDLYQVHFPDYKTPIDETIGALDDLVKMGKVRYLGCSNYPAWLLARSIGRSETLNLERFVCVQPRYNLLFRQMERELFSLCDYEKIGVIPYNPLAGGLLTGQHERTSPRAGSRFALESEQGERYRDRYWRDEFHDTVDQLKLITQNEGISMAQLAIAWVLSNPIVTSPIVGATSPIQLDDAIAAAANPLDTNLITQVNELTSQYRIGDDER